MNNDKTVELISDVQVCPIKPRDGLVAFASIVFADAFYFGSIGIYTRPQGGYRLTYPTRKLMNNDLKLYYPINKEIGKKIEEAIISKYEELITPSYSNEGQEE